MVRLTNEQGNQKTMFIRDGISGTQGKKTGGEGEGDLEEKDSAVRRGEKNPL